MHEGNHEYRFTAADFSRIREIIGERAGIKLSEQKKEMVYSRLSRRVRTLGLNSFEEYLAYLEGDDGPEWEAFIGALTTHLTSFFREPHHFPILADHVRTRAGGSQILLWSCAASTGEEPLSMAMTMVDLFDSFTPPVRILASDVDSNVLEVARQGIYPIERLNRLPAYTVRRFFQKGDGSHAGLVRVRPELQRLITFTRLNLLETVWPIRDHFDAIFCRNVMIYFDRPTQDRIQAHLQGYLKTDGLFFAGHSESLCHSAELFEPCGNTVYRRRPPCPAPQPVRRPVMRDHGTSHHQWMSI